MKFHETDDVRIVLPEAALDVIFDECDRFDRDEAGGRLIGQFQERAATLTLQVTGIIESGPQTRRSPVSFFQDGKYQEGVFRHIEELFPEIEHLGSWHTHHVNGLQTLSGGDLATYHRTVNHKNHNIPFFYALLVTTKHRSKAPRERYEIKHYLFRRGEDRVFEVPTPHVEIVDRKLIWPLPAEEYQKVKGVIPSDPKPTERVYDRDFLGEFYSAIRPFSSEKLGFYWRGSLELVDGSQLHVVVLEGAGREAATYSVALPKPPDLLKTTAEELARMEFSSARAALVMTERTCNRAVHQTHRPSRDSTSSTKG